MDLKELQEEIIRLTDLNASTTVFFVISLNTTLS